MAVLKKPVNKKKQNLMLIGAILLIISLISGYLLISSKKKGTVVPYNFLTKVSYIDPSRLGDDVIQSPRMKDFISDFQAFKTIMDDYNLMSLVEVEFAYVSDNFYAYSDSRFTYEFDYETLYIVNQDFYECGITIRNGVYMIYYSSGDISYFYSLEGESLIFDTSDTSYEAIRKNNSIGLKSSYSSEGLTFEYEYYHLLDLSLNYVDVTYAYPNDVNVKMNLYLFADICDDWKINETSSKFVKGEEEIPTKEFINEQLKYFLDYITYFLVDGTPTALPCLIILPNTPFPWE